GRPPVVPRRLAVPNHRTTAGGIPMRALARSWLRRTDRFWNLLLGRRTPPQLARRVSVERLEARDQTGNLVNGLFAALFGGRVTEPIQAMALAVGDLALLGRTPADPGPQVASLATSPVSAGRDGSPDAELAPPAAPQSRGSAARGGTSVEEAASVRRRPGDMGDL